MSNADRLRSGLGLPMSDRLVTTGPVRRRAPITSPHPSLAHPGQWIRRHIRRYTLQGAAFTILNSIHMTESARPASQTPRVLRSILRHPYGSDRLQKNLPTEPAHHSAPLRASGRPHPTPAGKTNPCPIGLGRVPPTHAGHLNSTIHPHPQPKHHIHRKLPIAHPVSSF
jgi:hypothetical protein